MLIHGSYCACFVHLSITISDDNMVIIFLDIQYLRSPLPLVLDPLGIDSIPIRWMSDCVLSIFLHLSSSSHPASKSSTVPKSHDSNTRGACQHYHCKHICDRFPSSTPPPVRWRLEASTHASKHSRYIQSTLATLNIPNRDRVTALCLPPCMLQSHLRRT